MSRDDLLSAYGRFYGEERFAVAFTAGIEGDEAKRVTTRGWDKALPLAGADYAEGLISQRGLDRNVAVVLRPSNLVVIESDTEEDLARIDGLDLPETLTVRSSAPYRRHFYFRPPEQLEALPYVAFRFESGKVTADSGRYFLAPPSVHPSGAIYSFVAGHGPGEADIVELPERVYRHLCEIAERETSEQRERIRVEPEAKILAGQRRDLIFRYACMLRRWGRPYEAILSECLRFNEERCLPPVPADLVAVQVQGAMKKEGDQELQAIAEQNGGPIVPARIVTIEQFVGVEEPGATPLLGTADGPVIPEGGDVMLYGDGGVGKTTLSIDLAFHLAAGEEWLGIPVPRPTRILLIENEGPRPLFRRKLGQKLAAWQGSPVEDRIRIVEHPWASFSFAEEAWRERLADLVAEYDLDLVLAGPVVTSGMETAGTMQEVRAFIGLIDEVRRLAARRFAAILVHHENKGGKVSGAWEGSGDTLLHAQQQGHGKLRLHFQKARWASDYHLTTMHLSWADGATFIREDQAPRPERVRDAIAAYVHYHGGCTWNAVATSEEVVGERAFLARKRDELLSEGVLFNTGEQGRFLLWHRDDPERPLSLDDELGDSEPIRPPESSSDSADRITSRITEPPPEEGVVGASDSAIPPVRGIARSESLRSPPPDAPDDGEDNPFL